MDPVAKAAWCIEHSFGRGIVLGDVAAAAGVSPYHLLRSFAAVTGRPVMRHVRARRLSEAAKVLAGGADSVLGVAIDTGYGSHEAFTRAFRQQFGVAPETVRACGLANLELVEAIKMDETLLETLAEPRMETSRAMTIAGISGHFDQQTAAGIPALWQRFQEVYTAIDEPADPAVAYGACYNFDGEGAFDYLCGLELKPGADVPAGMTTARIPAQAYAVFIHDGHISTIRRTWMTIFGKWFATCGYESAPAPEFERYDARFDPATGNGAVELWIPVKPKP